MKVKFGMMMVDGRGKLGGQVASKNRTGAYVRTKVTPVNGQTSYQTGVRNLLTTLSQGWRGLTNAQRIAWNNAVADFSKTNIFGDTVLPTGKNLYQRLNNNLTQIGVAVISTPPLPEAVGEVVASGLTATEAVPSLSLTMSGPVPANTSVKVMATAPQSPGKFFVKSEYRQIAILPAAEATPYDLLAEYTAKFGAIGVAGQKIFVKLQAVNATTGQTGTPSSVSAIIGA